MEKTNKVKNRKMGFGTIKTQLCKNISSIENPTAPIKNSTLKKDVIYYSN